MYVQGKKVTCVQAETGTLIFAVINLLATTTSSILSAVSYNYWGIYHLVNQGRERRLPHGDYDYTKTLTPGCLLSMVASFTALTFAVFLLHGILKKTPEFLRAYYIYGVVVTCLSVLAALAYMMLIELQNAHDFGTVVVVFLLCFLYSLILRMIRITYEKFEAHKIKQECSNKSAPI